MDASRGVLYAIAAAVLFGASTPFAKELLGSVDPVLLAGLLYAGSGIGLGVWLLLRRLAGPRSTEAALQNRDLPWLAGAVAFGGVLGPMLLMLGLRNTPASSASLLLNLESVLTAVLAWTVFRENVDRRVFLGMVAIVAGGVVLSWQQQTAAGVPWSALAIAGACLCWAIDNNLTRKVAASDAVLVACVKGLAAGVVNLGAAWLMGSSLPPRGVIGAAMLVGFVGYGVSLVLFVLALRHLGAARAAAYFSVAPFFGAALAVVMLDDSITLRLVGAGLLMALGVWLHLRERHEHTHTHEAQAHTHAHSHDEHHRHSHDFPWDGREPHTHPHEHEALVHAHTHYPDVHHRHPHQTGR